MDVAISDLLFMYLVRPYLGDVGICQFYFFALPNSIVHDVCVCVYIYIYICACVCVGDCALCIMESHGYASDPC